MAENRDDIVPPLASTSTTKGSAETANANKGRQADLRDMIQKQEQVTEEAATIVETSKEDTKDVAAEGDVKDADGNVRAAADDPDGEDILTHALEQVMDEYFANPSGGDGEGGDDREDGDAVERGGRDGGAEPKEEEGKAHEDREKKPAASEAGDAKEEHEDDHTCAAVERGGRDGGMKGVDADVEDAAEHKEEEGKVHEDREKKAAANEAGDAKEERKDDHACAASGKVGEDTKLGAHDLEHVAPVEVNAVPAEAAAKSDAAEGPSASCAESGSAEAPRTPTPTPVAKESAQDQECSPTQPTPAAMCPKPDQPAEPADEVPGRVMLVPSPCRPARRLQEQGQVNAAEVTANEQQKGQKALNLCMIEKTACRIHGCMYTALHVHTCPQVSITIPVPVPASLNSYLVLKLLTMFDKNGHVHSSAVSVPRVTHVKEKMPARHVVCTELASALHEHTCHGFLS